VPLADIAQSIGPAMRGLNVGSVIEAAACDFSYQSLFEEVRNVVLQRALALGGVGSDRFTTEC
jgi:hypothetical protein